MSVKSQYTFPENNQNRVINCFVGQGFLTTTPLSATIPVGIPNTDCAALTLNDGLYTCNGEITLTVSAGTTIEQLDIYYSNEPASGGGGSAIQFSNTAVLDYTASAPTTITANLSITVPVTITSVQYIGVKGSSTGAALQVTAVKLRAIKVGL